MKAQLKVIKIIHIALVTGLILAYFILGNLSDLSQLKLPLVDSNNIVYLLIPIAAIVVGNLLFKSLISKIDPKLSFEEKFIPYQSASIVRWAIIEGAAFVILIIKPEFIVFGLFLIAYLVLLMPNDYRIKRDLKHLD